MMKKLVAIKAKCDALQDELNRLWLQHYIYNLSGQCEYPKNPQLPNRITFIQGELLAAAEEFSSEVISVQREIDSIPCKTERETAETILSKVMRGSWK